MTICEMNEDGFRYFTRKEFVCSHSGEEEMEDAFIHRLDHLRYVCDFPFVITSGYRSTEHPVERHKPNPGTHCLGVAADISIRGGVQRRKIVSIALKMGFTGVGVAKTFIHVDDRTTEPMLWSY